MKMRNATKEERASIDNYIKLIPEPIYSFTKEELKEHDAKIRADAIDEFVKECVDEEEVCEWKIVDRPNGFPIYNTSCGAIRLACIKGIDICCNCCGRKIKVVE